MPTYFPQQVMINTFQTIYIYIYIYTLYTDIYIYIYVCVCVCLIIIIIIYIYILHNVRLLWVCLKNRLRSRPSSCRGPGRISDEGRAELDEDELTPAQVELDGELGLMVDGRYWKINGRYPWMVN